MSRSFKLLALFGFGAAALLGPVLVLFGAGQGDAAFGDSESFGATRLSSSTVEVRSGDQTVPVTAPNLAPGSRIVGAIEVENTGTLAVRYSLGSESSEDPLLDWVRWELWPATAGGSCSEELVTSPLSDGRLPGGQDPVSIIGDPAVGLDPNDRIIESGSSDLLCVAATLAIDAPNHLQARSVEQEFVVSAEQHIEDESP